jgi:hypothetical protein
MFLRFELNKKGKHYDPAREVIFPLLWVEFFELNN